MDWYFSYNPLLRGAVWAIGSWVLIEALKPGFAFADVDGEFITRPFGRSKSIELDDGDIISGTLFTWWAVPLLAFIIFGLFV